MPPKLATNTLIALHSHISKKLALNISKSTYSQYPDAGDDGDRHERRGGEEQRPCQAHRRGHGHHVQVVLKKDNFGEDCYIIGENFDDYDYGDFEEGNKSTSDHDDGDENDGMGMGTW